MTLRSINPATGEIVATYRTMTDDEAARVVEEVHVAWERWQAMPLEERSTPMRRAAELLRENRERYARLMAQEMGKPLSQGESEVEKCAWVCDYYAEHAGAFLAEEIVESDASRSYITFAPLGPVLAIMPWNFPFWQLFRFAAPALMAGNAALLKHAENVTGCAQAIEEIFRDAGFPSDLLRHLPVEVHQVRAIIENPRVSAVTLTGSTRAGRAVAAQAGAVLKKTVLELGGSDPYIVLEDANLESATTTCVASRLINSGQSCIAAKRFIVVDAVRERFETLFTGKMKKQRVGDPLSGEPVDLGPLAREDLRDNLHRQVVESVEAGARLLLGGRVPDGPGAFYPPTVLTDVRRGMPAYDEETFGPVAAIIPVRDEREAIEVANDTSYGLGAAVFTEDIARGERIAARELRAGAAFVNGLVKSDPRLPFGGIKESGYGRELGAFGIREFVNIKSVWIA